MRKLAVTHPVQLYIGRTLGWLLNTDRQFRLDTHNYSNLFVSWAER